MAGSILAALDALKAARDAEGAALTDVLFGLVDKIADLTAQAAALAGEQPAVLKERFERRMRELVGDPAGLEERIVQEAACASPQPDHVARLAAPLLDTLD